MMCINGAKFKTDTQFINSLSTIEQEGLNKINSKWMDETDRWTQIKHRINPNDKSKLNEENYSKRGGVEQIDEHGLNKHRIYTNNKKRLSDEELNEMK